ncbi:MAG: hypothetical protein LBM99_03585 [Bacillales bacterium]|jgi:HPt (histidine-containing phosphotransfer) domain-containing protein|nr:hypothetical protein [Bacillales bacterium]
MAVAEDFLPYYDIKQGLTRLGNNKMLYRMLLPKLIPNLLTEYNKFLVEYEAGNYVQAETIIHTVKGTSGNLSVNDVHFRLADLDVKLKYLKDPTLGPAPSKEEVQPLIDALLVSINKSVEVYPEVLTFLA